MKLSVGKVVDNMTRWSYIPIGSVKSSDDYSSLVHSIGTGHVLIRIRPIRHTKLVKVIICLVGNIRKRGRGVTWITIKIRKIIVISHITQKMSNTSKEKQTNKQTDKKKEKNSKLS